MEKWIAAVVDAVLTGGAKRATKYVSPTSVVTATFHGKRLKGVRSQSVMVTVGKPNYAQREKIKRWKKLGAGVPAKIVVATLVLCLLPTLAMAQYTPEFEFDPRIGVNSSVVAIVMGPHAGDLWLDAGVSYRIYKMRSAHMALLFRALKIEDQSPTSFGVSGLWIEHNVMGWNRLDMIYEIGGANKLAAGDAGEKDWGLITGVAANLHISDQSSIFLGAKVFQNKPGRIESIGVGGGVVLYADDWLGKLWPGN
jgi:hypothetical protein